MIAEQARLAAEVVDWRRRVFALYAAVRENADPEDAHELWRIERDELLVRHPASPLLPADRLLFEGVPIAPYDPAWRFSLPLVPADPLSFEFATGTDGVVSFDRVAAVEVPEVGTLDVWKLTSYGGGLFVPVRDSLAGSPHGTYGGGRYLIDTIKGADLGSDPAIGTIVLDFNFAYNPSCAYDPAWACPLAPLGNVVTAAIPVGELSPRH
jgi:uncharacterized protein